MGQETRLQEFVDLSAILTGVPGKTLKPSVDPIGIAQTYLSYVDKAWGEEAVNRLLDTFKTCNVKGKSNQEIGQCVLDHPDVSQLAKSVMKMWYLGSWYPPDDSQSPGTVVSAQAYQVSLAWKVMQAHPMGYSTGEFGYWKDDPPPLEAFVGKEPS